MPARSRFLQYLTLLIVLALLATACVRPLSRDEGDADGADADIDVAATVESGGEEDQAAGQETGGDEAAEQPAGEPVTEEEAAAEEAGQVTETEEESMEEPAAEAEEAAPEEATAEEEMDSAEEEAAEEMDAEEMDESAEAEAAESEPAEEMAETAEAEAEDTVEAEAAATEEEAEAAAETTSTEPLVHIVQPGENLYRIGLQYNISWVRLAEFNGLTNANYIQAGQALRIPPAAQPSQPEEEPPATTNYVVLPGDNLYRIGLKFGISWVEIAEANGIVNPNQIYAGQVLKIPTSAPGPSPEFTHDVQPGESLYRISLRYGVHWRAVAEANDLKSPYVIYPGQTLVIPGG